MSGDGFEMTDLLSFLRVSEDLVEAYIIRYTVCCRW